MQSAGTIILTLKDIFRWCKNPNFYHLAKQKNIIACAVDIEFYNMQSKKIDIHNLITSYLEVKTHV